MKIAAFDLEIAKILPEDETDWHQHRPLGITCAAVCRMGGEESPVFDMFATGNGRMPVDEVRDLVRSLQAVVKMGYTLVTWNGAAFDFQVLADESGMWLECAELALNHVDLMYNVVCVKGHYLGLSAASSGCGVVPKLKTVTLKDGSTLEDMNGAKAPELWSAGERNAVLTYLERDVLTTAQLAAFVRDTGFIRWISRKGRKNIARVKLTPVTEALENIPYPNTGWMSDPPDRREMIAWALETVGVNHE